MVHLNCRCIPKYIDEIKLILSSYNLHVISLNETHLCVSITDAEINFSGYSFIRCDRNHSGGGVLLAIKNSFTIEQCICGADFGIEASSAKLSLGSKSFVVSSIYRPPSSDIKYFNNVVTIWRRFYHSDMILFLWGILTLTC